jgi:uncharacterized protein (TIGR02284 family)
MKTDKIVSKLNKLLTRNYDAEQGYHKAAEHVKDPDLKRLFEVYSDQRYHFGHDLKGEIKRLGGDLDKGPSFTSKVHRTWMDLKSAVTSDDTESMLEECVRGENAAVEDYKEVLKETNLPEETRTILHDHIAKIEESLYLVQELEKQH